MIGFEAARARVKIVEEMNVVVWRRSMMEGFEGTARPVPGFPGIPRIVVQLFIVQVLLTMSNTVAAKYNKSEIIRNKIARKLGREKSINYNYAKLALFFPV